MRRHPESLLLAVVLSLLSTPFGLEAQSQESTWTSFESFEIADVPASSVPLLTIDPLGNRWGPSQRNEVNDLGLQEEGGGNGGKCLMIAAGTGGLLVGLFAAAVVDFGAVVAVGVGIGALAGLVIGLPICAIAT